MCLLSTKIIRVKTDLWLILAEQWRRIFAFIVRRMSRSPSNYLMKLVIDNNAAILVVIWKPLP